MATIDSSRPVSGPCTRGVLLEGVSWETYEKLVDGFGDCRSYVTYDNGLMEIEMSPGRRHERGSGVLIALVNAIRAIQGLNIETGGSTTHQRPDLAKGVEPDACYWIANERAMRGVNKLDLTKHPAPDLAVEFDVTSSSIDKIEIYRQLGVPELWLSSDSGLEFLVLDASGDYQPSETSLGFPIVSRSAVERAISAAESIGEGPAVTQLLIDLKLR